MLAEEESCRIPYVQLSETRKSGVGRVLWCEVDEVHLHYASVEKQRTMRRETLNMSVVASSEPQMAVWSGKGSEK